MSIKPVLVLDGDQRSALAVTRSLGKNNVPVITASANRRAICRFSRYSQSHLVYPDPKNKPGKFLQWLSSYLADNDIGVVYPLTDITCNILAPSGPSIGNTRIPLAHIDTIKSLSDKAALTKLAEQLGIPHPKSLYITSINEIDEVKALIIFPCVIKPAFSKFLMHGRWVNTAVSIVNNEPELNRLLDTELYLRNQPFMVQEYIQGTGQGLFALYDHGNEIVYFAHRRIREKPPWGGVSVLSESVAPSPEMLDAARKILNHASWHGVAMVEFKVSSSGIPYLIEINTRFWGSLQLAVDAGVDFPYLLHKVTMGEEVKALNNYKYGKKLRWLMGDLDRLLIILKRGEFNVREKFNSLIGFFKIDFKHTKNEIFRAEDIKPAVFELREYFSSLFRKNQNS